MQVREITAEEHLAYIGTKDSVSFLQTPAWGKTKAGWGHRSIGWFDGDVLVGAGLLLLRKVPRVSKYLAYFPEGPDLDWSSPTVVDSLAVLVEYLRGLGVFQVKIGPHMSVRRWESETLKEAIAEGTAKHISDVAPDFINDNSTALVTALRGGGWVQKTSAKAGFGDFQPRFVFHIGLEGKTEDQIFAEFNQLWRRNIRKAEKEGVTVRRGTKDDLALFHECYVETAARDKFSPRPLSYFTTMWDALTAEDPSRMSVFIAEHPDHDGAIAATTLTRVGNHSWYSYGASTTASRDLRPSNAVQWVMIKDSLAAGSSVYDMRGIADTLDSANHLFGLIQFKLGTGGYAQEYVGEWDFVISKPWATAFALYMARR